MKLQEILIERIDLTKETPIVFGDMTLVPSGELIGSATQAQVFHTGQGMVTKVVDISRDQSVVDFIEISHQHQDNPFFPKIYNARLYKDKNDFNYKVLVVQTEKLIPLTHLKTIDNVIAIFQSLKLEIDQNKLKTFSRIYRNQYDEEEADKRAQVTAYMETFEKLFTSESSLNDFAEKSNNPQFIQAIEILQPWFERYESDLHFKNVMVRLTSVGPQLVIIDPFLPKM